MNWFMDPDDDNLATKWVPADDAALRRLVEEGEAIAALVQENPEASHVFRAGTTDSGV